jgi:hypothetical protein
LYLCVNYSFHVLGQRNPRLPKKQFYEYQGLW